MSYVASTVPGPAPLPFDAPAVAAAALDILRLDASDEDAARVQEAAVRACHLVELELDYAVAPTTNDPHPQGAAVTLTVELYRRKDAPFGMTDSWSVDGTSLRISADVMRGVRSELVKLRSRWSIG